MMPGPYKKVTDWQLTDVDVEVNADIDIDCQVGVDIDINIDYQVCITKPVSLPKKSRHNQTRALKFLIRAECYKTFSFVTYGYS